MPRAASSGATSKSGTSATVRKPAAPADASIAGPSSQAVEKATGKGWADWLKILDQAGARHLPHKQIAELLHEKHGVPGWWAQTVTVGYEQARGLRKEHEQPDGFQISASKTINVPLSDLFKAWNDEKRRAAWLGDPALTVRKATTDRSIRITWDEGREKATHVDVHFYDKGASKSQVALNHGKLKTAAAGEKMKKYWGQRLDALKSSLES